MSYRLAFALFIVFVAALVPVTASVRPAVAQSPRINGDPCVQPPL